MTGLFDPFALRSLTLPNRVWMAPMCQYCAPTTGADTGVAGDWHFAHYAARAVGGAGLVLVEATGVSSEGRISPADLGLWNDRQVAGLRRITRFLTGQGTVPGIQLAHAGRKASTDRPWRGGSPLAPEAGGWRPVGPSPLAFDDGHPVPAELTVDRIHKITRQFADAARRALDAGFQVAEIHGAHGYLIGEFLSPHSNHRTDGYGGDLAGRTRFALEVTEAVRAVWPDELPLFFRVSATDWLTEGGWTVEDTVTLAAELRNRGVDLLDVSTGGNVPDVRIPTGPGYQVPFATRVREETGLPVAAVGLITEPGQAAGILAAGEADAVLLGRQLLREPSWPQRAARELGATVPVPAPYSRAVRGRPRELVDA
ncbi:NADH:flavin oxidoreductase/NADH oxidase [Streptomyces durbertensis]|uniref:NADH:flavin oxidoreductase/NADH oxidase n=1 Tax=Streptomyces durbertensis TaxID=2448886 RepID=A0ABR6EIN7_9ACTN|nr:NADH:flavin oxidoreductase/NADH oxidase [Streptomyces durbertensis]MBB1245186.1 NADH:flavin oxidoreductase/NADH oxidase [Streptomyces durbertensis]